MPTKPPQKPVICLLGPTASGKTALALWLSKHLSLEIVSVDSAMVYRGMDIGTAKPTAEELSQVPHHLINLCDPTEVYSAGRFYVDAQKIIKEIHERQRLPLLVGGTMLYFHVIQKGFSDLPTADITLRKKIQQKADELGWQTLHQQLEKIDPHAAAKIHYNDAQRIQRALEIYYVTGQSVTEQRKVQQFCAMPYHFINLILTVEDRELLYQRIIKRFDDMLQGKVVEEVERLHARSDLHVDLPAMRTVGYRQIWDYLEKKIDFETMRNKAIIATRQLVKRQMTWLRRWEDAKWFNSKDANLEKSVLDYLCKNLYE